MGKKKKNKYPHNQYEEAKKTLIDAITGSVELRKYWCFGSIVKFIVSDPKLLEKLLLLQSDAPEAKVSMDGLWNKLCQEMRVVGVDDYYVSDKNMFQLLSVFVCMFIHMLEGCQESIPANYFSAGHFLSQNSSAEALLKNNGWEEKQNLPQSDSQAFKAPIIYQGDAEFLSCYHEYIFLPLGDACKITCDSFESNS